MYRMAIALLTATLPLTCAAAGCRVSGTAYDTAGKPTPSVVRLTNVDSGQQVFAATNRSAAFAIDGAGDGSYRIDLLSHPGIVTGSRLPIRSIVGQSPVFACATGAQTQDVHAEVDY